MNVKAPVRLRDKGYVWVPLTRAGDGVPPELPGGDVAHGGRARSFLPCRAERVVEDEHRHVAADPVTARRDLAEHVGHRGTQRGNAVIQLGRVSPGGEGGGGAAGGGGPPSPPRRGATSYAGMG